MVDLDFYGTGKFTSDSFEGKEYQGNLYLNSDEGGIMLEFEILHQGGPLSYLEIPLEIKYITGELSNGFKMTLLNCTRQSTESKIGWGDTFTYLAEYMIEGLKIPNGNMDKFTEVYFDIPESILWGNRSKYYIDDGFGLFDKEKERLKIYSNDELTIDYQVFGSKLPVHEIDLLNQEIILKQRPSIKILSNTPKSFSFFLSKFKHVRRFIEIGMNRPVIVTSITVITVDEVLKLNNFDLEFPQSFQVSSWNKKIDKSYPKFRDRSSYLFNLDDVLEKGNLNIYVENKKKLEPVLDLYLDFVYSKNMTVTQAFLNVTQALETYHSRFVCRGTLSEFKQRIENIILKDVPEGNREYYRKILLANSQRKITLQSRIADLLLADFAVHFYTGEISYEDFPMRVVSTRNYYTHYDERKRDQIIPDEDLQYYLSILKYILEYYMLKELGFSDVEFRKQCISEKMRRISIHFDVVRARK